MVSRTVGDLLARLNVCLGVNDNLLFAVDRDNLGGAVGRATMVNEASVSAVASQPSIQPSVLHCEGAPEVPLLRGVHNEVLVDSEEVAASDALSLVRLLAPVRDLLADELPDVLDDHLSSGNRPLKKHGSGMAGRLEGERTHSSAKRP